MFIIFLQKLIEVLNQIYPLRIIVVCGTVDKVEDVSEMLQQRLSSFSTHTESADATDTETLKRRKLTVVEQYVYPMSPENKRVSDSFEGNEINVVVTTHTFGMGLPRADVIIYYTMPRTYESLMNGIHQVRRQQQGHVHVLLDEQVMKPSPHIVFCSSTDCIPINSCIILTPEMRTPHYSVKWTDFPVPALLKKITHHCY